MTTPLKIEDLPAAVELLADRQQAYFRLSVEVSVSTALLVIFAVNQLQHANLQSMAFLVLLLGGHGLHLARLSPAAKVVTGSLTIAVAVGSFVLDPTGSSFVGLLGGAFSGLLHIAGRNDNSPTAFDKLLRRIALLKVVNTIDWFATEIGWKRHLGTHSTVADAISDIEAESKLRYTKKGTKWFGHGATLIVQWEAVPSPMLTLPSTEEFAISFEGELIESDLVVQAELRAIDDLVKFQAKVYEHYVQLGQAVMVPMRLAQQLLDQSATLLDKYKNPQNHVQAAQPQDGSVVDQVLQSLQNLSASTIAMGLPLQQVLLLFHEIKRDRNDLATARRAGLSRWKTFEERVTQIRSTVGLAPDQEKHFRIVLAQLESEIEGLDKF